MWPITLLTLALAPPPQRRPSAPPHKPSSVPFVQTASNQLRVQNEATFRAWPALNDDTMRCAVNAGRRYRLHLQDDGREDPTLLLLQGDSLMNKFALALAQRRAIDRKEFFEACEFFSRVREKLKADDGVGVLIDVAGGHGLVGALAAIFMSRRFQQVVVRDMRRPQAFDAVCEAAVEVAPWVEGRIVFEETKIGPGYAPLPRGCAIVCVHGCKGLTDTIIDAAADADARSVALMPCCYRSTAADAPAALRTALGVPLAADVHRTYELERLGYSVKWSAIPRSISPMNRIILAHRPARPDGKRNSRSVER